MRPPFALPLFLGEFEASSRQCVLLAGCRKASAVQSAVGQYSEQSDSRVSVSFRKHLSSAPQAINGSSVIILHSSRPLTRLPKSEAAALDPVAAASAARFCHVSDDFPGITRQKARHGFDFRDPDGRLIGALWTAAGLIVAGVLLGALAARRARDHRSVSRAAARDASRSAAIPATAPMPAEISPL